MTILSQVYSGHDTADVLIPCLIGCATHPDAVQSGHVTPWQQGSNGQCEYDCE